MGIWRRGGEGHEAGLVDNVSTLTPGPAFEVCYLNHSLARMLHLENHLAQMIDMRFSLRLPHLKHSLDFSPLFYVCGTKMAFGDTNGDIESRRVQLLPRVRQLPFAVQVHHSPLRNHLLLMMS